MVNKCLSCVHEKVKRYWFRPMNIECEVWSKIDKNKRHLVNLTGCIYYEATEYQRIVERNW